MGSQSKQLILVFIFFNMKRCSQHGFSCTKMFLIHLKIIFFFLLKWDTSSPPSLSLKMFCVEKGFPYVSQAGLKLKAILLFQFPNAGITGMCHHAWYELSSIPGQEQMTVPLAKCVLGMVLIPCRSHVPHYWHSTQKFLWNYRWPCSCYQAPRKW